MQSVLDLVWDKLLPAFKPSPLPSADAATAKLRARLAGLTIEPQKGTGRPATFPAGRYAFPANDRKIESIALESDGGNVALKLRIDGVDRRILCGAGAWVAGRVGVRTWIDGRLGSGLATDQPVEASGAWTGADAFRAKLCFPETPFLITLDLKFEGDRLLFDAQSNVGFGPTRQPRLEGKAE